MRVFCLHAQSRYTLAADLGKDLTEFENIFPSEREHHEAVVERHEFKHMLLGDIAFVPLAAHAAYVYYRHVHASVVVLTGFGKQCVCSPVEHVALRAVYGHVLGCIAQHYGHLCFEGGFLRG